MDKIFPYDLNLYDRRFMNCGQRQAIVFLGRKNVPVDLLFYNALPTSDMVMQQVIVEKSPKYAYKSNFMCSDDLAAIGIQSHTTEADRFSDISTIAEHEHRQGGFVLLSGDVFYLPHCPEYRKVHMGHIIVLSGRDKSGNWHIVDDNPASVLCEYIYENFLVQQFFENNGNRILRRFEVNQSITEQMSCKVILQCFRKFLHEYYDTYWFYDNIEQVLDNPFDSQAIKWKTLHEAFTLLSGSRFCFAAFLEKVGAVAELIDKTREFAENAFILKSMMVKAQIVGKLDIPNIKNYCNVLKNNDLEILAKLRSFELKHV